MSKHSDQLDKHWAKYSHDRRISHWHLLYATSRWRAHTLRCSVTGILAGFTAKAGCSFATKVFFHNTPGHDPQDYLDWPHPYRLAYQRRQPTHLRDWFHLDTVAVKFVRNPFSRAVSSYFQAMRTRLNLVIAQSQGQEVLDWSFEQYLQWLSTTRLDFTNPHFGTQKFWGEGLIFKFDHVIKVESVGENIPLGQGKYLRVPPETRASKHHNPRQNLEGYFGDLPYSGLRNEYGTFPAWENFYNDATKALVVDLFGIDFSAYSYPTEIA